MSFKQEYPDRYDETKKSLLDFLESNKGIEFRTANLVDLDGFTAGNMQVQEVLEDLEKESPVHEVDKGAWKYEKGSLNEFK